jgi:hypothetical protein
MALGEDTWEAMSEYCTGVTDVHFEMRETDPDLCLALMDIPGVDFPSFLQGICVQMLYHFDALKKIEATILWEEQEDEPCRSPADKERIIENWRSGTQGALDKVEECVELTVKGVPAPARSWELLKERLINT